jgi:PKD repeat protein
MRTNFILFYLLLISVSVVGQTITPNGSATYCAGGSVLLTVNGAAGGSNFQWRQGTTTVGSNQNTYSASVNGIYTVIVTPGSGGTPDTLGPVNVSSTPKPVVDFVVPALACSGTSFVFNSNISSGTAPYSYAWDFDDGGTSSSANPSHVFNSLGCGTGTFNVKLTVTDSKGCSNSVTKAVSVKQAPDVQLQDQNVFSPFNNCSNSPTVANPNYTLTVDNISPNASCINSYNINWGDGNIQNGVTFPLSHTYTILGAFNLVVTAVAANGCNNSKTYVVANQSNPAGSLGTLGSTTNLCASANVPFTISNWTLNSPGTTYILNFGDGASVTLSHPLNPGFTDDTVNHLYLTSSCPSPSYTATLTVLNACDQTPYTAGNIQIRIKPTADFDINVSPSCTGNQVCFNNVTTAGSYGPTCSTIATYLWDFGDGSATSTLQNPCHIYTVAGTYPVTLSSTNPCGTTTKTKQVCIVKPLIPGFTLDNVSGCIPLNVNATDTTNTTGCQAPTYKWTVTYASAFCGTSQGFAFINGTTDTSANPSFRFDSTGTYTITQSVTNACGTFTSSKTVSVKKPPTATINIPSYPCGIVTISPTATVTNCGTGALGYSWTFIDANPLTDNTTTPTVTFTTAGVHPISLSVSNECGSTVANESVTVSVAPNINATGDQSLCGGANTTAINFSSTVGTPTYEWTNNNASIGLASSGTGNIAAFATINTGTTPVTATVIVTPVVSTNCKGVPDTFTITVNPKPIAPLVSSPLTYCLNEVAPALTATAGAGNTLTWYNNSSLTGGAVTAPTPVTTVQGTTSFYVTQTNSFTCRSDAAQIDVTVNPGINGNVISADQTICAGTAPNALGSGSVSGGSGSYIYQWQSSLTGNAPWVNIAGGASSSFSPPVLNDTIWYRRVVVSTPCSDTSNSIRIIVQGALSNFGIAANQVICEGSTPALLTGQLPAGGGGNYNYQWYSSIDNASWNSIGGATLQNYQPGVLSVTTYFKRELDAANCDATSNVVTVTVNPKPVAAIAANPSAVCVYDAASVSFTATSGTAPYSIVLVVTKPGGITDTIRQTVNNNGPVNIQVIAPESATGNYTIQLFEVTDNNGCIRTNITPSANILVKPRPVLVLSASPVSVCNGNSSILTASGADTYNWSPAATLSAATGSSVTATPTITTTYSIRGTLNGCFKDSSLAVTVIPGAVTANAGPNQVLCNVATTTLAGNAASLNATGTWRQVSGPAATITNAAQNNSTITGLVAGRTYIFEWKITGQAPCPPTISNVSIDVLSPIVNTIKNDTIVCNGQTALIYTNSLSGGSSDSIPALYTYQWESTPQGQNNWSVISGETNETLSQSPATSICYRRKVKTNALCESISNSICVVVNPAITNNIISATQERCVTIAPANLTGTVPTGGDGVYVYSWEESTDSLTWSAIGNAQNYQPPTYNATGVHFFRRSVTSGNCTDVSNVVKVIIHPDSKAIFTATNSISCAIFDLNTVINVTHLPDSNGTYSWYADNAFIGSNSNGTFAGYSMNNPGDTVIIKLVTASQFGCKPDSMQLQFVTVRTAVADFIKDAAGGCGPLTVNFTNTSSIINPGIQFSWDFGNDVSSTLAQPAPVTFVQSPDYRDTVYQVSLKAYNGCDTTIHRDSIKIRSNPKARFALDTTAGCSPFHIVVTNNSLGTPNTYYWDFGNGHKDTTFSNGSFNYTYNIGNVVDTFPVRLIAVNECASDTQVINVRVAPNIIRPQVTVSASELFGCTPHIVSFVNATTGATSFTWDYGDGSANDITNNVQTVVTHTFNNPGTFTVSINMTNGCSDTTIYKQVTVYGKPIAAFTTNAAVYCLGDTVKVSNSSQNANNYRWFWGDGQSSSGFEPVHVYNTAGSYNIMLRAERTNNNGLVCFDTFVQSITILIKPDVTVQSNITNINCAPFTLNATAPGIINEAVTWFITDTTVTPSVIVLNGVNVSYTFNKPGTFTVKMLAVNSIGCTDSTIKTLVVRGTPAASFTPDAISVCKTDTTVAYLNSTTFNDFGPLTYRWLVDGSLKGTNGNFTYQYFSAPNILLPRIFTTQLIATNSVGCSDTAVGILQMNPNAKAQFSLGNTNQCVPFILPVNNASQYASKYQWYLNGVLADTAANPAIVITQALTPYRLQLIADNGFGCRPDTFELGFTSRIKPIAAFGLSDTLGCTGVLNVATTNRSSNANSYVWDWGDATAQSSFTSPSHLYNTQGQYVISLVASDGVCKDTAYRNVYVSQKPVVDFSVNDSVTCDTARIHFTNLTSGATGYLWSFSDGTTSTAIEPDKNFPPSLSYYTVRLVAYNALGCRDSLIKPNLIFAKVPPAADFIINPSPVIAIPQYTFSFDNITTNNNQYTYQWTLGDGSFESSRDVVHKYADTGSYEVRLVVFDNNSGCPDTSIKIATIQGAPGYLYVPNAFYPNSLQQQFKTFKPLGKGLASYTFQVFDGWGKLLFQSSELDAAGSPVAGWDGTFKGMPMPQNAYAWRISAKFRNGRQWDGMSYGNNLDPKPGNTFGTVTLFR